MKCVSIKRMNMFGRMRTVISEKKLLIKGSGLRARSARGIAVLALGTSVEMALRLLRNMLLTRLLVPESFGLMALVMSATLAFQAFTEVGIKHSVIQNKRGDDPEYLNVAWWLQAVRAMGLFLFGFFGAPLVSAFYDNPELLRLLRVAFIAVLFNGFISPRAHVLERKLQFSRIVIVMQGGAFIAVLITIVLAIWLRSIWALVIGLVLEAAMKSILSYILCPFKPSFHMHGEHVRELLRFAKGMVGLSILTIITFQMDVIVLGKVVTAEWLGLYHMAVILSQYPAGLFIKIIYPLLLPVFSESQKDFQKINKMLLAATQVVTIFGLPFSLSLMLCSRVILSIVWGAKYEVVAVAGSH